MVYFYYPPLSSGFLWRTANKTPITTHSMTAPHAPSLDLTAFYSTTHILYNICSSTHSTLLRLLKFQSQIFEHTCCGVLVYLSGKFLNF